MREKPNERKSTKNKHFQVKHKISFKIYYSHHLSIEEILKSSNANDISTRENQNQNVANLAFDFQSYDTAQKNYRQNSI